MKRLGGKRRDRFDGENVDPMSYLSNLSDVMLILAVGIMLALVVHWNVDITTSGGQSQGTTAGENGSVLVDKDHAAAMTPEEMERLQQQEGLSGGEDLEKRGEVYYDAKTGTYYIVPNTAGN